MARSRFSLFALCLVAAALFSTAVSRAVAFVRDIIDTLIIVTNPSAVADLFRRTDSLAFAGPAGRSIDPALAHDQRHEAGLARLGAVRHR